MKKMYFNKQLLAEQYSSVLKGVVDVDDEDLILAGVCKLARKDLKSPDHAYSFTDCSVFDIIYAGLYNDCAHYFVGTVYGKLPEVSERVERFCDDKDFVDEMVKHAEHFLNQQTALSV